VDNPGAPSFIAVDRLKGKVVWQDASPGDRLLQASRGSPALGVVDGIPQVAFPGGDGWLYAFEPATGKLLWKFNCKAHEKRESGLVPATPVYVGHRVLVALASDPAVWSGDGCLRVIDARGRGDVTSTHEGWRLAGEETGDFGSAFSPASVHDGLVYIAEQAGFLDCIELETGKRVWRHDLLAILSGSPVVADGKVYLQTVDGEVLVYQAGRTLKLLARNVLPRAGPGTIAVANGRLYVNGWTRLYAIEETRK
jgi:outer membrane protein assembly factor BamB